jgi:hypothetical protein
VGQTALIHPFKPYTLLSVESRQHCRSLGSCGVEWCLVFP